MSAQPTGGPVSGILPVAEGRRLRHHLGLLVRPHRGALAVVVLLDGTAALGGLAGPSILGRMVEDVTNRSGAGPVDRLALLFALALLAQTLLTFVARARGAALGERLLAELRESFVRRVVALPLSTVEQADTGDLLARASGDIEQLQDTVRRAAPELLIAAVEAVAIVVAVTITAPVLGLPLLAGAFPLAAVTWWYRRRAPEGYRRQLAAEARVVAGIAETASAGSTVEALGLAPRRLQGTEQDVAGSVRAQRDTLRLRSVFFPVTEFAYYLPLVSVVVLGGELHRHGRLGLGAVVTVALYLRQLVDPLDTLLSWLDELQIGGASLARLFGVADVPGGLPVSGEVPHGGAVQATDVRYAYPGGGDVLHAISLRVHPGARVAVVGPSGAGKSTLGRLLAGVMTPRSGTVTVGGATTSGLAPEVLRRSVALVSQEHHVFVASVRENLLLGAPGAGDDRVLAALVAVDAEAWVRALPAGLDTAVGSGGHPLSPGQAQQLALARLVLADPDILVLDEATSLLDPGAARHLERSLTALLEGRTVVAIAHRLSTAFDADLVAVVDDGRIHEIGTHDELVAAGGAYSALWRSWHDDRDG